MPPRHHRTIDRTITILEEVSRAGEGISLAEIATLLDAPKSSIQELTNGLLATGYLVERDRRYLLGPGAYVLSLRTSGLPMRQVRHEELERAQERVGLTLFAGTRVGDDQVFIDQAGEDVLLDWVSATHPRRPLLLTATGKIILAQMPSAFLAACSIEKCPFGRACAPRPIPAPAPALWLAHRNAPPAPRRPGAASPARMSVEEMQLSPPMRHRRASRRQGCGERYGPDGPPSPHPRSRKT